MEFSQELKRFFIYTTNRLALEQRISMNDCVANLENWSEVDDFIKNSNHEAYFHIIDVDKEAGSFNLTRYDVYKGKLNWKSYQNI